MHVQYTLGRRPNDDYYETATVRSPFTRNLTGRYDVLRDEILAGFQEYIPLTEGK